MEEQAIKAVSIIAQHRKSQFLLSWIDSGFSNETQMDPAEGYQALQIHNREIEDEMILMQYNIAVEENPASVEFYTKALTAIANGRNSTMLLDHLHARAPQAPRGTSDEPVGLENIGNTCYLNSLLQVLFTTIDLREVVLNFDNYKMSLDPSSIERKRVGQRQISSKEVQTAQKCKYWQYSRMCHCLTPSVVTSLASLFHQMIQTPQSSIRPEQELARLTLESHNLKEKIRRRSTLKSVDRPSLGQTDDLPFFGPLTVEENERNGMGDDVVQSPAENIESDPLDKDTLVADGEAHHDPDNATDDNASEETLVSKADLDGSLDGVKEVDQRAISGQQRKFPPDQDQPSPQESIVQESKLRTFCASISIEAELPSRRIFARNGVRRGTNERRASKIPSPTWKATSSTAPEAR